MKISVFPHHADEQQEADGRRLVGVHLDLYIPHEYGYDFKVVTSKEIIARKVVAFHNGRGAQEGVFAELKSQEHLDYVPTRTLTGNQTYMLAAIMAQKLNREMQLVATEKTLRTT